MAERSNITTPFDVADVQDLPDVIPFTVEQRSYVMSLLKAIQSVMEESSSLEIEEKQILGNGKFFWPKDPSKPIMTVKSYPVENFRMKSIYLRFERQHEHAPWAKVGLAVHPKNFPKGAYAMKLPPTVFNDFMLIDVREERREHERIENPVVFHFRHQRIKDLLLQVESRNDLANFKDSYPSSFHAIQMERKRME